MAANLLCSLKHCRQLESLRMLKVRAVPPISLCTLKSSWMLPNVGRFLALHSLKSQLFSRLRRAGASKPAGPSPPDSLMSLKVPAERPDRHMGRWHGRGLPVCGRSCRPKRRVRSTRDQPEAPAGSATARSKIQLIFASNRVLLVLKSINNSAGRDGKWSYESDTVPPNPPTDSLKRSSPAYNFRISILGLNIVL